MKKIRSIPQSFLTAIPLIKSAVMAAFALSLFASASRSQADANPGAPYDLGTTIRFAAQGNGKPFRVSGWSQPEPEFTWTEGTKAVLKFQGLPAAVGLSIRASLVGLTNGISLPAQTAEVYANDRKIAEWQVGAEKSEYSAALGSDVIGQDGSLVLEFRMPKAASPKQLGQSQEPRVLGLRFYELTINKAQP